MLDILKIEEEKLKRIIEHCVKELSHAPEGFLYIKKRNNRIDCYQAINRKDNDGRWKQVRHYIPQSNLELIGDLQQKKLRSQQMREAEKKLKAVERCRKVYEAENRQGYADAFYDKYGKTVTYRCSEWDAEIKAWMNKQEHNSTMNPKNKSFMTRNGISVRSKSELLIADALESYNIPYKYDVVLDLSGQYVSPNFMILRPYDKKLLLWEHYGLIIKRDYEASTDKKRSIYKAHGYYPWDSLIETYDNEQGGIDIRMIDTLIRGFFLV